MGSVDVKMSGPEKKEVQSVQLVCGELGDIENSKALPCDQCGETVRTNVSSSTTTFGLIWMMTCCCVCCLPWAFLPLCIKNFKKFHHKCSKCGKILQISRPTFTKTKRFLLGTMIAAYVILVLMFTY